MLCDATVKQSNKHYLLPITILYHILYVYRIIQILSDTYYIVILLYCILQI